MLLKFTEACVAICNAAKTKKNFFAGRIKTREPRATQFK